jgi:hypothetical protein
MVYRRQVLNTHREWSRSCCSNGGSVNGNSNRSRSCRTNTAPTHYLRDAVDPRLHEGDERGDCNEPTEQVDHPFVPFQYHWRTPEVVVLRDVRRDIAPETWASMPSLAQRMLIRRCGQKSLPTRLLHEHCVPTASVPPCCCDCKCGRLKLALPAPYTLRRRGRALLQCRVFLIAAALLLSLDVFGCREQDESHAFVHYSLHTPIGYDQKQSVRRTVPSALLRICHHEYYAGQRCRHHRRCECPLACDWRKCFVPSCVQSTLACDPHAVRAPPSRRRTHDPAPPACLHRTRRLVVECEASRWPLPLSL